MRGGDKVLLNECFRTTRFLDDSILPPSSVTRQDEARGAGQGGEGGGGTGGGGQK